MELDYTDYIEYVENIIRDEIIRDTVGKVKTLGKFIKTDEGLWEPVHYAGYTIITPTPGNDASNQVSLNKLRMIKQTLSEFLNPSKIVAAPDDALHMTVARLISGETFEKSLLKIQENEFFKAFNQVFNEINIPGELRFEIKGLVVFSQGVIAAVVSPAGEDDYKSLQWFRDSIYSNGELMGFGVERKRGFHGHISLFYIEEELSCEEKDLLAVMLIKANRIYFSKPLPYYIANAQIRKFDNFLRFYRRDNWPAYKFE